MLLFYPRKRRGVCGGLEEFETCCTRFTAFLFLFDRLSFFSSVRRGKLIDARNKSGRRGFVLGIVGNSVFYLSR